MVDWKPYLQKICADYDQWWKAYTLTDVVGKKHHSQVKKSLLLDLQAIAVKPEAIKPENELLSEASEKREILNVLEGLRKYASEHVLLIGRPGSGKSTALKRLLLEQAVAISTTGGKTQIPVLVELRYYQTSIIDLIKDFLHRHDPSLPIDGGEKIKELLRQGQFLLLLDGVNELPSPEARRDLQKFRQDFHKTTPMIFTTRDLGVGGDLEISKKLEMQPLTETQMRDFVRGYLPEVGEQMLKQLGDRLRKFGETPLLLVMLCSVFASNQNKLPPNLGSVFREFTNSYIHDSKLKGDVPVYENYPDWCPNLLQQLAFKMMQGSAPTEFLLNVSRNEAEDIFCEYLQQEKFEKPRNYAKRWLDDLLKHHLIQLGAENKMEFRHQLIQEYYAAERFLQEVKNLSDDELQWDYLNDLKWTEPVVLMMELVEDEALALRVMKLALQVDWQLGARLAGAVKSQWQEKTVGLISDLGLPRLLEIRLLGITKSEVAIPGLIKLLEDQDSSVRWSAAEALGQIGSSQAIPGLIKLLEDQYSSVRWSAAEALIKIGSSQAIPSLIKLLEDQDLSVRWSAAEALIKIGSSQAIPSLIKLLEHQDSSVRWSAAEALIKIGSSQAITGLIKILEHQDLEVRWRAAKALGEIGSSQAIPGLIKLLEDQDLEVRWSAAEALGQIGSSQAIPGLIKLLEEQNSEVRRKAAEALIKIGSSQAIPGLIKLLEDQDSEVRRKAAEALIKIGSSQAISGFIKVLEHQDSEVRWQAAYALGEIGSSQAIPGLIKLLEHQDSSVRWRAAEALAKIGSSQAVPQLIQFLSIETFVTANKGDNLSLAIQVLETIQQHCKRYKPTPIRTMSNLLSHNYALLIGVGECEEPKLSLPVTVKDIQSIKTLLTDQNLCGYIDNDQHLRLLHDETATTQNILDSLNWLKQQAENDPEATIFIYYSGHGCLDESGDYYLIPHETDRVDIPNTALSAVKFNAALQQIPAKQLLVIIDSCHAQGMAASKDNTGKNNRSTLPKGFTQTALPKNIINELKQGTGRVVFTSSTGKQSSYIRPDDKMSVYTYHLLEALQGAANQPGDKVVRVSHLMNYLGKTVPQSAQQLYKEEQTPFFDFATEDFPVASLRGGKGLPQEGWDNVKTEAQENIRSISNQVNNGVGIVGDENVGFNNISAGGDFIFNKTSSK